LVELLQVVDELFAFSSSSMIFLWIAGALLGDAALGLGRHEHS